MNDCPQQMVTADVADAVMAADDAKSGHLPVQGGTLDQCESFVRAWRFIRQEHVHHEAEAMKRK